MTTLDDQLMDLRSDWHRHHDQNEVMKTSQQIISTSIIELLHQHRFYGEMFLQIPRQVDWQLSEPLGLGYQQNQIQLFYNPKQLAQRAITSASIRSNLEQVALHLIFKHPLLHPKDDQWTRLATDLVVNQYQPDQDQALNLDRFNYRFGLHLPPNLGSKQYLKMLLGTEAKKKRALAKQNQQRQSDAHQHWPSFDRSAKLTLKGQISHLINQAWQNTDSHSRGQMDGNVIQHIQSSAPLNQVPWQRYLSQGFSDQIRGSQETIARFDRRQPYRMDLHGSVPNFLQNVNLFVDNSGSMSDHAVELLLAQIAGLLKRFHPVVTLFSFDNQVHYQQKYRLQHANQIKFQRFGGGGTSFQSILDWLNTHQHDRNALNVILTDGYGEHRLNYHHPFPLLWVVTQPKQRFSVQNIHGTVISLPQLDRKEESK